MTSIKILICGAMGRMGLTIANMVHQSSDLVLVGGVDIRSGELFGAEVVKGEHMRDLIGRVKPDVVVDFTVAAAAVENIPVAAEMGCAIVLGTTGFSESQREKINNAIVAGKVPAVISTNFSIGMNVFWTLVRQAAQQLHEYDVEVIEAHHRFKKDAPSGTAKKLAQEIARAKNINLDEVVIYGREGMIGERKRGEIGIHSIRSGDITGEHTVMFTALGERLELTHKAHSRDTFAYGTIQAIKFMEGKPAGFYEMKDVLKI